MFSLCKKNKLLLEFCFMKRNDLGSFISVINDLVLIAYVIWFMHVNKVLGGSSLAHGETNCSVSISTCRPSKRSSLDYLTREATLDAQTKMQ